MKVPRCRCQIYVCIKQIAMAQIIRHHRIMLGALLPGSGCYTYASIVLDQPQRPKGSWVGGFNSSLYIQARVNNSVLILMAEATALALVGSVASLLNLHSPSYLSDNQQLVNFLNGTDHSSPPD